MPSNGDMFKAIEARDEMKKKETMSSASAGSLGSAAAASAAEEQKRALEEKEAAIVVKHLDFVYFGDHILKDCSFTLKKGARCILAGANGAGKSTLLRILSGKHFAKFEELRILDMPFIQDQENGLSFLGNNWSRSVPFAGGSVAYQCDIRAGDLMKSLQEKYPEKRKELYSLLEINPDWRMHQVSDGQRRRVQIMLGLLKPFRVLFMDEITVDLDVVARQDLLNYLHEQSEKNGVTIVYATHIFDGLDRWATHLLRITDGHCNSAITTAEDADFQEQVSFLRAYCLVSSRLVSSCFLGRRDDG